MPIDTKNSVTTATILYFKEPLLLRRDGSSGSKPENLGFLPFGIELNSNMKAEKVFFELGFGALQTLHFHFKFSKKQSGKGFKVVTLADKCINSVTFCYKHVTKRNKLLQIACNNAGKGFEAFVTNVTR